MLWRSILRPMRLLLISSLFAAVFSHAMDGNRPLPAPVDIAPPNQISCRGRKAGAECRADGKEGTCQPAKCTKSDYSNGPPPKRIQIDCLVCTPPQKK